MRRSLAGALVALLAATPALAAEPESGSVSNASPAVTWEGVSDAGFTHTFSWILIHSVQDSAPCQAPSCDTFTLDVKDSADLDIVVTSDVSIAYVQVEKPDGTVVYNDGIEPEGADPDYDTKVRIRKAPVGTYKVQTALNSLNPGKTYTGQATLATAAVAAPAAPAVEAPAPPAAPGEPAAPAAPAAAPATVTVKAGKLSARKLARTRKLPLTLNASAPVSGVRVILAAKGRALATGRIKTLDGTVKYALKLRRKLKAGRYDLVVEGKDAGGSAVGVKTRLRIAR